MFRVSPLVASSINHSDLSVVFAAPEHIPFLLTLSPKLPTLKMVVSIEPLEDDEKRVLNAWAKSRNLKFMDIAEREQACLLIPLVSSRADCMRSGGVGTREPHRRYSRHIKHAGHYLLYLGACSSRLP